MKDHKTNLPLFVTSVLYAAFVISGVLAIFLSNEKFLGWDLYPQYYLAELMTRNLSQGAIQSYDLNWFAGYPSFTFYGPLPYVIVALLHFISFKLLSVTLALNLVIFLLPFLFLYALVQCFKVFLGNNGGSVGVLFALMYLTFPSNPHSGPYGLFGSLMHGHFSAFFAATLLILFFVALEKLRLLPSRRRALVAGLLLGSIILSHALTTIFAALYLGLFTLFHGKNIIKSLLILVVVALSLSFISWWPLLMHFEFSSGELLGIDTDPLLLLFPGLSKLKECLKHFWDRPPFGFLPAAFLLLTCTLVGMRALLRDGKPFLPTVAIISLFILPRNFLTSIFEVGIHYNRFIFPLVPIIIIIAVAGFQQILNSIKKFRRPFSRAIMKSGLAIIVLWSLICTGVQKYEFSPWSRIEATHFYRNSFLACDARSITSPPIAETQVPVLSDVIELGNFLSHLDNPGRIAVQSAHSDIQLLGTPHFLATWLPMYKGIPVINGLLAESSYSTGFIIPVFAALTEGMVWGRNRIQRMFGYRPTPESLIRRLAMFGVRYLILTNKNFLSNYIEKTQSLVEGIPANALSVASNLNSEPSVEFVESFGVFHLFKLGDPRQLLTATAYKPFLFVEMGGINFREFSEIWYQYDLLLNYPVIFTDKDFFSLTQREQDSIGGIILSSRAGTLLSAKDLERWVNSGKKILLLDGSIDIHAQDTSSIKSLRSDNFDRFIVDLGMHLARPNSFDNVLKPKVFTDGRIEFEHSGAVIINLSFYPRWQSSDRSQTLFQITPSQMFVVAQGETKLRYGKLW